MQATRGTPLTSARRTGPAACRTLFALVAVVGLGLDQLAKALAVAQLTDGSRVDVLGALLGFRLVRNPGAAFSTGTEFTEFFAVLAVVAAVVVLYFARRLGDRWWALGLGFVLAGVLGNLMDRLFREPGFGGGHVVDFLELPHWPIFNLADMWLNIGVGLIILQTFRGVSLAGGRALDRDVAVDD